MIKQAIVLGFCLAAGAQAQVIRDSMQAVGGGGRYTRIATDAEMQRIREAKETPANMTANMIWVTPGKVLARHKQDGKITLEISYEKKTDTGSEAGTYLVADHPDAPYIAVDEQARCIIVPGPICDDFGGRRLYYFFDKKEVNERNTLQFKARHGDAPLN
ncbi:MAG: hypothetical protein EBR82_42990 [Caulobacteraceae bacterium]|nr:hypothetical protein [Caulobacteraceae bacterium]